MPLVSLGCNHVSSTDLDPGQISSFAINFLSYFMEESMIDINDEMKTAADTAIKSAKERFGQELDYSEEA